MASLERLPAVTSLPSTLMTSLAHPHAHLSNRAKVRSALDRKPVFKGVLENPFQIAWCVPFPSRQHTPNHHIRPSVPTNVQNLVLARLVATLENAPLRTHAAQGRNGHVTESSHLLVGINAVTRALESQLRVTRTHVLEDPSQHHGQVPSSPIGVVCVCCADVDPSALVAHIPYLVAGCNSPRNGTQPIKLIPLPKGSEPTLSQILGIRRAAVLAFRVWERVFDCGVLIAHGLVAQCGSPLSEAVRDILGPVPIVSAPWLCPSDTQGQLVPTHNKQLCTTAPKDMKCAREQRSKARAAAKQNASRSVRRKSRITLTTRSEGPT